MAFIETDKQTDFVKIEMQNGDTIVVELNEKVAPITVANFKNSSRKAFTTDLFFTASSRDL